MVGATADPLECTRYLPAQVEIALAGGDLPEARGACQQLEATAGELRSEVLGAIAAHARGSVRLAEAPSYGQSVLEYAPMSPGALAYQSLAEEVIHRVSQG